MRKGKASKLSGYALVVANCVFTRFPIIPCNPILALMNPMQTNVSVLDHAGSDRASAVDGWPLFHTQSAAAIVKRAWMNVPRNSQARVLAPIRSPMRPRKAPKMKVMTDVRACLSARWKEVSRSPGGPWKRRARANAS